MIKVNTTTVHQYLCESTLPCETSVKQKRPTHCRPLLVRDLQRAMNSMLYERTELSTNKHAVLNNDVKQADLKAEKIFRNAYMLEFLGLGEKDIYIY